MSFDEANAMMVADAAEFKRRVQASLRRHIAAINTLTSRGMFFWDYGNSFLLECSRAGADVRNASGWKSGSGARHAGRRRRTVPSLIGCAPPSVPPVQVMSATDSKKFRYPSYVEDIMGDIFSLGFGPFRCCARVCVRLKHAVGNAHSGTYTQPPSRLPRGVHVGRPT